MGKKQELDAEEKGRLLVLPCRPEELDLRRAAELICADSQGRVLITGGPGDPGEPGLPGAMPMFTNGDALMEIVREHLGEIVCSDGIYFTGVSRAACRSSEKNCKRPAADCPECVKEWINQPYDGRLRWEKYPWRIEVMPDE